MQINQYKIIQIFGSPLWVINNRRGEILERAGVKKRLRQKVDNLISWRVVFYDNHREAIADTISLICVNSTINKK